MSEISVLNLIDVLRGAGPVIIAIALVSAVALGCVLGVLMMARRGSGRKVDEPGALDDALAATGAATIAVRLRGGERVEVTSLSSSIEALTGYVPQALCTGDAFFRMLEERSATELERKIAAAVRDERAMVAEFSYEDAEGLRRWMQLRAAPVAGGRKTRNTLQGVVRETTESRQTGGELVRAKSRFHALADATPAMLWVLDAAGKATAVNRATERFCGVGEAALLGEMWMLAVEEDDHEGLRQFVDRVLDEGTSLNREVVMIDPDNRERQIAMTATVAKNNNGDVESVVLTGRDVTDRSQSEQQRERLTRLIDSSGSPAMILAPDFRVTMLNPAARTLAGLKDGEAADSIALWHVVTQEAVEKIRNEATRYCADGGVFEMRGSLRDGGDGSLSAEIRVVGLGDGWLGVSARVIEQDLAREAEAQRNQRRLDVMLAALERLTGEAWAPGRAAERVCEAIASAHDDLRVSYGAVDEHGVLTCEASDEAAWMGSAVGRQLRFDDDGSLLKSLAEGEVVKVGDVWAESQLAESTVACEEFAVRRLALLRVDTGAPGLRLMALERPDAGRWATDELQALELASRMLGLALRAEGDRKARDDAETQAATQAERWRAERDRCDGLAQLAADRVTESERLLHRLQKSDKTWASALIELGAKASAAGELADEAREAGLKKVADQLGRIAHDADRAEVSGRIVSGTLTPSVSEFSPRGVLRTVGQRLLWETTARGIKLRIKQEGELPEAVTSDERLFRLACVELLAIGVDRCLSPELRATVAATGGEGDDPGMVELRIQGGPVSAPKEDRIGAPGGFALLRAIAEVLGGRFEVIEESAGTKLVLAASTKLPGNAAFDFNGLLGDDGEVGAVGDDGPLLGDDGEIQQAA
ncbi:MAG: PAS domain S-box protein [Planctomycetota bacterium]